MRHHRFIGDFDLSRDSVFVRDPSLVKQIQNVLRLKKGDEVVFSSGDSREALARIDAFDKTGIWFSVISRFENEAEPSRHVALYCALLKKENFEFVAQKATEVGVREIIPLLTTRTIKTNLNLHRLKKIIREAAEQSGRGRLPLLHEPVLFQKALLEVRGSPKNLFFSPHGEVHWSAIHVGSDTVVNVFIGPEGGWEEQEETMGRKAGFSLVTLGKLTLRAETAATLASYVAVWHNAN